MKRLLLLTLVVGGPPVFADSLVAPREISTSAAEVRLAFSPDGRQMLWGSIGRGADRDQEDIWERHRTRTGWSAPAKVSFDTSSVEFDPAFAPGGTTVYFHSDRRGGFGGTDLYRVSLDPATHRFGRPVNLGPTINSAKDEWAPTALKDGSLLFSSDGWGGFGRHDLFLHRPGARRPANLGAAINGADEDFDATLSPDGRELVFSSGVMSDTVGNVRLFLATWASGRPEPRRPLDVGCADFVIGSSFNARDPGTFYYSAICQGGLGRMDIWRHALTARGRFK